MFNSLVWKNGNAHLHIRNHELWRFHRKVRPVLKAGNDTVPPAHQSMKKGFLEKGRWSKPALVITPTGKPKTRAALQEERFQLLCEVEKIDRKIAALNRTRRRK